MSCFVIYYAYIANMLIRFPGVRNLDDVLTCFESLSLVHQWKRIGMRLKLTYSELRIIRNEETGENDRLAAMLYKWLRSDRATKETLVAALKYAINL